MQEITATLIEGEELNAAVRTRDSSKMPSDVRETLHKTIWVWAPALASEPRDVLLRWGREMATVAFGSEAKVVLVVNGPGSESACISLRRDMPRGVEVSWVSGPASIGRAQQLMTHQFLQSDARLLARIDPDGQFSVNCLKKLRSCLTPNGSDVIVAQRDEASIAGCMRFLGNVILRFLALCVGIVADPNSGCYVMNRKAAAVLCQTPLPKYPEPRMLMALKKASLTVSSQVVPILPRQGGRSSIKSLRRAALVFSSSLLEMFSWDQL